MNHKKEHKYANFGKVLKQFDSLHCGYKVLIWYVLLCLVALVIYAFLEARLNLNFREDLDKGSIVTLIVGMVAWTVAMIVPIAAFYAMAEWREQQRLLKLTEYAEETMRSILAVKKNLQILF